LARTRYRNSGIGKNACPTRRPCGTIAANTNEWRRSPSGNRTNNVLQSSGGCVQQDGKSTCRRRLNMVVRRQKSGAAEKSGTPEPGTEKTKTRDDKNGMAPCHPRTGPHSSVLNLFVHLCRPGFWRLWTLGERNRPPRSWLGRGRPAFQEIDCRPPSHAVR